MVADKYLTFFNGNKMPILGFGTFLATDPSDLEKALEIALETGYRHIDTAYAYRNEAVIGRVLQKWFQSKKLKREDLFITTKLPSFGVHPDRVDFFLKRSLANLQLDYVDLYLVHHPKGIQYDQEKDDRKLDEQGNGIPEPETDHAAVWRKMEEHVLAGRAKNIGLSNFSVEQIENLLKTARIKPANHQVELHVYYQQKPLRELCSKKGITIVGYGPLGAPGMVQRRRDRLGPNAPGLHDLLGDPTVNQIAQKHSKSPAQVLLRFLIELGVSPIPKSVTAKRIQENFDVFDFQLDQNDLKQLESLEKGPEGRIFGRNL